MKTQRLASSERCNGSRQGLCFGQNGEHFCCSKQIVGSIILLMYLLGKAFSFNGEFESDGKYYKQSSRTAVCIRLRSMSSIGDSRSDSTMVTFRSTFLLEWIASIYLMLIYPKSLTIEMKGTSQATPSMAIHPKRRRVWRYVVRRRATRRR